MHNNTKVDAILSASVFWQFRSRSFVVTTAKSAAHFILPQLLSTIYPSQPLLEYRWYYQEPDRELALSALSHDNESSARVVSGDASNTNLTSRWAPWPPWKLLTGLVCGHKLKHSIHNVAWHRVAEQIFRTLDDLMFGRVWSCSHWWVGTLNEHSVPHLICCQRPTTDVGGCWVRDTFSWVSKGTRFDYKTR